MNKNIIKYLIEHGVEINKKKMRIEKHHYLMHVKMEKSAN